MDLNTALHCGIWLLIWRTGSNGGCPNGWITYSSNCYKVNTALRGQAPARVDCQSEGGDLTSINDASEAAFIKSILYAFQLLLLQRANNVARYNSFIHSSIHSFIHSFIHL